MKPETVNPRRRALLFGGQFAAGVNAGARSSGPAAPVCRPPWAVAEAEFAAGCSGCGACLEACPQAILVRGAGDKPVVDFSRGGCSYCRGCADVCPEPVFSGPEVAPWALSMVITDRCLALAGVFCQSCRDACEVAAISFDRRPGAVPVPVLQADRCNGCGFCISVCPEQAIAIGSDTPSHGREASGERK